MIGIHLVRRNLLNFGQRSCRGMVHRNSIFVLTTCKVNSFPDCTMMLSYAPIRQLTIALFIDLLQNGLIVPTINKKVYIV
jgi:hypothetical protein